MCSCSSATNGLSANNRILLMPGTQESILYQSIIQQIPKSISDKVTAIQDGQHGGKFQGGANFKGNMEMAMIQKKVS